MIDTTDLAAAVTIVVIVTAALAGLVGGLAGSAATTWATRRRERSVADRAEDYLRRPSTRLRTKIDQWRGRR